MSRTSALSGLEGLRAGLLRLDLRLRIAVDSMRSDVAARARDPFHGLYISEPEVDAMLASTPPGEAARRLLGQTPGQMLPRLERLALLFGLSPLEQEIVLVCLGPELDQRYERLYGYLQDDATRRRPTVELVLRVLEAPLEGRIAARRMLGPSGRLVRSGILALADESAAHWPLLSRPLRVDDRVVEYLLGSDVMETTIEPYCRLLPPASKPEEMALPSDVGDGLLGLLARAESTPGPVIYLNGPVGTGKASTAQGLCASAALPLLLVDLSLLLSSSVGVAALPALMREALLQGAVLGIEGFDHALRDDREMEASRPNLRLLLSRHRGPIMLLGSARWEPATWFRNRIAVRVEMHAPGIAARLRAWQAQVDGQLPADQVADLAARYRISGEDISAVILSARSRAASLGDQPATPEDFRAAARTISAPPMEDVARRVEPRYGWEDIVLPPDTLSQLRELCDRARHYGTVLERWGFGRKHARRAGITGLFVGQPGTGKTMAAEIVAGALALDLYRIDLSSVVSKYIGETEKNLERIFRAADQGDALLLFDEADALFGKRSEVRDAHDRYANVEVAYLLQRLEAYEGVAILTSNLRGNIDEAFMRRLDYVLEFPMPEEAERLAIWRHALPREAPLGADVDLEFLARKFKLAGGHIRNIAVMAAFLAAPDGGPIAMRHLVRATRREHQKLGKLIGESDFEQYGRLLKRQGELGNR